MNTAFFFKLRYFVSAEEAMLYFVIYLFTYLFFAFLV